MLDGFFSWNSRHSAPKLIEYATRLGNAAVFKRLGFLLAASHPDERELIRGLPSVSYRQAYATRSATHLRQARLRVAIVGAASWKRTNGND